MNCSRSNNTKINKIEEGAVRLVYDDYTSEYQQLLSKDNSVTFHQRNLQHLCIEIFKTTMGLNPSFMRDIFTGNIECRYHTRSGQHLILPRTKTTRYGLCSLRYMAYKTWNNIPHIIRRINNLQTFKNEIKNGMLTNVIAGYVRDTHLALDLYDRAIYNLFCMFCMLLFLFVFVLFIDGMNYRYCELIKFIFVKTCNL